MCMCVSVCFAIKKDCVETQRCYGKYDLILRKMNIAKSRDTNPWNQKVFLFRDAKVFIYEAL